MVLLGVLHPCLWPLKGSWIHLFGGGSPSLSPALPCQYPLAGGGAYSGGLPHSLLLLMFYKSSASWPCWLSGRNNFKYLLSNAKALPCESSGESDNGDRKKVSPVKLKPRVCWPTFESFALGDSNDVDHFVLGEHLTDGNRLLHVFFCPLHFLRHCAPIQLDLHYVCFLLAPFHQPHLMHHTSLRLSCTLISSWTPTASTKEH